MCASSSPGKQVMIHSVASDTAAFGLGLSLSLSIHIYVYIHFFKGGRELDPKVLQLKSMHIYV